MRSKKRLSDGQKYLRKPFFRFRSSLELTFASGGSISIKTQRQSYNFSPGFFTKRPVLC
ncbi:hypothetical protein CLOSTMETH_03217 [[Clostridium] methylpentosum DSM 5476]|uniref:Uncharacterized protein n=1 Tax=[Clostridium] methylpentosum DSM 5476 TaxID=537013 RepID=C0EHI0_9FIRM|nr:hypothetical protein CLOSTMETH_03217 [[Clostridium] methylpentosum DSM 5476]